MRIGKVKIYKKDSKGEVVKDLNGKPVTIEKEGIILAKGDVEAFCKAQGWQYKYVGDDIQVADCPFCHGGDHNDKYKFGIDTKTGRYNCFRGTCGKSGHIKTLMATAKYAPYVQLMQQHKIPDKATEVAQTSEYKSWVVDGGRLGLELKDADREYLHQRGINDETIEKYQIYSGADDKQIALPFFNADGTELIAIKYRYYGDEVKTKETAEGGCGAYLYGLDWLQPNYHDTIVITEGMIDALSLLTAGAYEAGYDVTSVPFGCTNFAFLDNMACRELLTRYKHIIIMGDCVDGEITMVDKFYAALPLDTVLYAPLLSDYIGYKDANDILTADDFEGDESKEWLLQMLERAEETKQNDEIDGADVIITEEYRQCIFTTSLPSLTKATNGFAQGTVTLLLALSGAGKSVISTQCIADALNQGINVYWYSGEMTNADCMRTLYKQVAGTEYTTLCEDATSDYAFGRVQANVITWIRNKIRGRLSLYSDIALEEGAEENQYKQVIHNIERSIIRKNVKFIVIDNLMSLTDAIAEGNELYRTQKQLMTKLHKVANKYKVAILLCVHPKKPSGNLHFTQADVSGTFQISNKADVILAYELHAKTAQEKEPGYTNLIPSAYLRILKNRHFSVKTDDSSNGIPCKYRAKNQRVVEQDFANHAENDWKYPMITEMEQYIVRKDITG